MSSCNPYLAHRLGRVDVLVVKASATNVGDPGLTVRVAHTSYFKIGVLADT